MPTPLTAAQLRRDLAVRDLTDPAQGPHAVQLVVDAAVAALRRRWELDVLVRRDDPVVTVEENYDDLGYPPGSASRDERYTRYVDDGHVLRTMTSAMVPAALRALAGGQPADVLLVCPGIVYRRDAIDRLHTGTPHQLDLWRLAPRPLGAADLVALVEAVVDAVLPGRRPVLTPARHPYTVDGRQVDVLDDGGRLVEIAECGLAAPDLLVRCGLDPDRWSGLALGLGLDRLVMLRKGIDDIRLLRSDDPRVAEQQMDLTPYRPVSRQPAVVRDLSIAVPADDTTEHLGDRVRDSLGSAADAVEAVEILSETPWADLPDAARERLGLGPDDKNVLVRLVLRRLDRALTRPEANLLRDRVYAALHRPAHDGAGEHLHHAAR